MAGQSERMFLEDLCPALAERLGSKLAEEFTPKGGSEVGARGNIARLQDFEVGYSYRLEQGEGDDTVLRLQVMYPFLSEVLKNGSEVLLDRVWVGLPLKLRVEAEAGKEQVLDIAISRGAIGQDVEVRELCVRLLASVRVFLLIGPLVEKLRWLREASHGHPATASAAGPPPPMLEIRIRDMETLWIVSKPDRVSVIAAVNLDDEADVALGRAFCQEFAETNRTPSHFTPPCSFAESKDLPADLKSCPPANLPNVGFLTLTLSDQSVRGISEDRLHSLAIPVMTFRNFFLYQLKNAKSYLHSRMRKRLDGWQRELHGARRAPRKSQEKRRLVSGKEFVPPAP